MDATIIVALIAFAGSLVGTFAGISVNSSLTNHRIEELEKKVDKHNDLVERMYSVESKICLLDEKIKQGGN